MAFSDFETDSLETRPKEDQKELMVDMTLLTLETEWMESRSLPLDRRGLLKKDTYAEEVSVLIFSKRIFIGPTGTERSSKLERR